MINDSNEDDDGKKEQASDDSISGPNGELLDASIVGEAPHMCCSTDTEPAECLVIASTSVATDSEQILTQADSVMPTYTHTYPIALEVQPVSSEMMSDLEEVLAIEPGSSLTEPETVANVLDSSSVELKPVSTATKPKLHDDSLCKEVLSNTTNLSQGTIFDTKAVNTCSIIYPDYLSPAFDTSLQMPEPKQKRSASRLRDMLPKAISGKDALRIFQERKERKAREEEEKNKRREDREAKRREKAEEKERKKNERELKRREREEKKLKNASAQNDRSEKKFVKCWMITTVEVRVII